MSGRWRTGAFGPRSTAPSDMDDRRFHAYRMARYGFDPRHSVAVPAGSSLVDLVAGLPSVDGPTEAIIQMAQANVIRAATRAR